MDPEWCASDIGIKIKKSRFPSTIRHIHKPFQMIQLFSFYILTLFLYVLLLLSSKFSNCSNHLIYISILYSFIHISLKIAVDPTLLFYLFLVFHPPEKIHLQ